MKNLFLIGMLSLLFMACGNNGQKKQTADNVQDADVVNVYYFHGKQRCKTCIAVGDLAKQTVESDYAGNKKVKFTEIETTDKAFEALVEKYEVSWNALIIDKNNNPVDITEQAFANALNSPDVLTGLIKDEVNKRLN